MAFKLGDRFSFQFCNQNEVASDGSRTEDFAFTLDAEHAPKVQFGPVQVGLSGMGELKVRCKVGQDHCYGAGAIEFAVELGVGLGELITAAVGGRGGLEVEVPTQTAGAPQDTFKVVGSLTPYGTVDLFAGLISFEVPYKYPGIEVTFDRLGPFPLQNPNNKADDTISIAAKWTVEVSFLGIFTFTVSVPITVMPETTLWKATPDMYGKQPWFTSDCELVERTYDRCSQNHIKLTGTWDEKTGEWERHIQKGHEAYSMISSDPKKDFRWCCGHSWCDEWVRFDRHVNKIVVQLENSDRRIVWVGLVCDRYLHDNNRFHYSGRTDDGCREDVRVETARGWVHVPKHHRKGVMMHRWSDNRWTWYCNHNSRRRGYRQGHHGSGCGRHNYLVVDWQDRRRNTAVRWECWQRLGKERPTSGTCTSAENFYFRPWSSWSFGVDSPQARGCVLKT
ncbi:unnamed protein product [Symbiodinium natans]|uniref:Uncharacterized protein n=1 Tax=Symbiodinium natans TaxID=878477 RepID=A0A812ICP8_9DINO|nr:unnamed protein product [Symbiodinium natans]